MELLFFIALGFLALVGAIGVVVSRNAVYSALALLLNFAVLAVMYFMLNAQFLGVVQVIVYTGAIVVLFLFVIMLIGGQLAPGSTLASGRRQTRVAALILSVLMAVGLSIVVVLGALAPTTGIVPDFGSVQAIGQVLFTEYLLPFELASVLLLVAMIGAVVLARRPKKL
ncbi:MAG: NADH-quinone oxidoreductase subunit J [Chloroflexota bacterium]|nr:NADH-quinone oxidoreductase subunit J [Chloroflexota bacterium]